MRKMNEPAKLLSRKIVDDRPVLMCKLHGCGAGYAVLKGCDRNARRSMNEAAGIGAGACDVGSDCWVPNRAHLNCLRGYGVAHNAAVKALYYTGNDCPELALAWVIENSGSPAEEEELPPELQRHIVDESAAMGNTDSQNKPRAAAVGDEGYKMVFVVNTELGMGVGKVAAQVGHAAVGLFSDLIAEKSVYDQSVRAWEEYGAKKICLKGQSTQHLTGLRAHCEEVGLPCYLVRDAGRTQIPSGSLTVLAVFGPESQVNLVTGSLQLL
ncbi:unnamed protein product [Notodromas monacha]|uniref:peptidyl-tRNA hydrolase n=1 Tax=Notodromas monacha TaxID=399045 RepID=A0A7R9BSE7_9CRUS|nr:unnamed protein product [Notodromas monacha]CAG0920842.1 unnamed protein product [Notodromas monacha]